MRDSFRYAIREVIRRKRRSAAATASYLLVGSIVVVISSIAGITRDTTQSVLWDIGAHSVAYIPRLTIEGCCVQTYATDTYDPDREGFVANNAPTNLIPDNMVETIRQSPYIADASPYLMFRIRSSLGPGEWTLGGIDLTRPLAYSATVVASSQVVEGEFIKPGDDDLIMIEHEFASVYGLETGSVLDLGERSYTVAAIVNPPLRPGKSNIYMTLEGLRGLISTRLEVDVENPVNAVLIESLGARYHDLAQADVAYILGQTSRISSFGCSSPGVTVMGIHEKTTWTISFIVLFCMLLLAVKIQYSSVIERRNDIGILKAVGWRDRNVVYQLMAETFLCSVAGGVAGVLIAIGIVLSLPAEITSGRNIVPGALILTAGLLLPVAGGMTAGLIASFKAVRMQTADILRKI
jgi:hypothetical protein